MHFGSRKERRWRTVNTKIFFLLMLLTQSALADGLRSDLPSDADRIRGQRLFLAGITGQATSEKFAGKLSTNTEQTDAEISLNIYRLLKRDSNMFYGYRSIPRALRNLQFSLSAPVGSSVSDNLGFGLTWSYNHAHKWDEYWDRYFPEIQFPENVNEVTDEWLDATQHKLARASAQVDSLLLFEGNNGISFAVSANWQNSEWEYYSFSLIGSHRLGQGYTTFNGAVGKFPDDIDVFSVKFAGQYLREFWPTISDECGGVVFSFATSLIFAAENVGFEQRSVDWQIVPAVNLPTFLDPKLRLLISYDISREEGKFFSGLTYQVLPGK